MRSAQLRFQDFKYKILRFVILVRYRYYRFLILPDFKCLFFCSKIFLFPLACFSFTYMDLGDLMGKKKNLMQNVFVV